MKPFTLLILNTITLFMTLLVNYLGGTGEILKNSVGQISERFPTLITPAGYAFAIWGLIYFLLLGFLGFQWYTYYKKDAKKSILPSGLWFSLANCFNALWIVFWTQAWIFVSVLLILGLLVSLIQLTLKLKLEIWDAPISTIAFVWWPICIYLGWVILATVLNISVWVKSTGLLENIWTPEGWSMLMIGVATLIYTGLIHKRNMREAAAVGIWGFIAIAYAQWETQTGIRNFALLASAVLLVQAIWQALKNFHTLPFMKIKRGEF